MKDNSQMVQNKENENPNPKGEIQKPNKDNVFKKIGRKIGNGFSKVRESPVATAIGAVGGAILTGVGILTYGYLKSRHSEEEELWEEEPIEQEFDETEEVESEETDDATEE